VAADGLRAPATVDGVLAEAGREYELRPALDWDPRPLLAAAPRMRQVPGFAADFGVDAARALDLPGFAAALTLGRRHYARAAARFDRAHRPDYALIDIADARAFGIRPIEGGEAGDAQAGNAAAATAK
jgi:hypothetical protein